MSTHLRFGSKWAGVIVLLVIAAGCGREKKPDPVAALNDAYKAGLLTKEEFDAKLKALPGAAATPATPVTPPPSAAPAPTAHVEPPGNGAAPGAVDAAPSPAPPNAPTAPPSAPAASARPASSLTSASPLKASGLTASGLGASGPQSQPAVAQLAPRAVTNSVASAASAVRVEQKVQQKENEDEPALAGGCVDQEFKSGGQKLGSRFYPAPPDAVSQAAVSALNALDFDIHKNTPKEIEATKRRHIGALIGAGGEKVKLTFKPTKQGGESGTLVTGETKKNFVGRLAQRSWTDAVLAETACKLREGR